MFQSKTARIILITVWFCLGALLIALIQLAQGDPDAQSAVTKLIIGYCLSVPIMIYVLKRLKGQENDSFPHKMK